MNERLLELDLQPSFCCVRLLLLHPKQNTCIVGNAGISPIPIFRHDPDLVETVTLNRAVPLGMISNDLIRERSPFEETRITTYSGDTVLFYTDGIEESESPIGKPFGETKSLSIFSNALKSGVALDKVIETLVGEIRNHRKGEKTKSDIPILLIQTTT